MPTSDPTQLTDLEQPYLTFLQTNRRMLPRTLRAHASDLRHFLAWQDGRPWEQVQQDYFAAHPSWTATTARIKRLRLQRFLQFARAQGHPGGPLRTHNGHPQHSAHGAKIVAQADIQAIFETIPSRQLRDALLFRLLYFARLRISEATQLRVQDVWIGSSPSLSLQLTRNARPMLIHLEHAWLAEHFPTYLAGRTAGEYLFRAAKNGRPEPLKQQSLHKRWLAYARNARVPCSMEDLRISGAEHFVGSFAETGIRPQDDDRPKRQPSE